MIIIVKSPRNVIIMSYIINRSGVMVPGEVCNASEIQDHAKLVQNYFKLFTTIIIIINYTIN